MPYYKKENDSRLKGAGRCSMVWGKDILVPLSISHDRSEFPQVCNMQWGCLFEAVVITEG